MLEVGWLESGAAGRLLEQLLAAASSAATASAFVASISANLTDFFVPGVPACVAPPDEELLSADFAGEAVADPSPLPAPVAATSARYAATPLAAFAAVGGVVAAKGGVCVGEGDAGALAPTLNERELFASAGAFPAAERPREFIAASAAAGLAGLLLEAPPTLDAGAGSAAGAAAAHDGGGSGEFSETGLTSGRLVCMSCSPGQP